MTKKTEKEGFKALGLQASVIMNVYEYNGKNIFIRWRGDSRVEWKIPSFTE
jgi:hypothetical protein